MTWDFPPFSWFSCVLGSIRLSRKYTGWWFGTFFICPYIGNKKSQLTNVFLQGLKPPTSIYIYIHIYINIYVYICHHWGQSVQTAWRAFDERSSLRSAPRGPSPNGGVRAACCSFSSVWTTSFSRHQIHQIHQIIQGGAPGHDNVQLVNITPITVVYIGDISIVFMGL